MRLKTAWSLIDGIDVISTRVDNLLTAATHQIVFAGITLQRSIVKH
jgi:hypothetical protein